MQHVDGDRRDSALSHPVERERDHVEVPRPDLVGLRLQLLEVDAVDHRQHDARIGRPRAVVFHRPRVHEPALELLDRGGAPEQGEPEPDAQSDDRAVQGPERALGDVEPRRFAHRGPMVRSPPIHGTHRESRPRPGRTWAPPPAQRSRVAGPQQEDPLRGRRVRGGHARRDLRVLLVRPRRPQPPPRVPGDVAEGRPHGRAGPRPPRGQGRRRLRHDAPVPVGHQARLRAGRSARPRHEPRRGADDRAAGRGQGGRRPHEPREGPGRTLRRPRTHP